MREGSVMKPTAVHPERFPTHGQFCFLYPFPTLTIFWQSKPQTYLIPKYFKVHSENVRSSELSTITALKT